MKKIYLSLAALLFTFLVPAQNPTYRQKLYYTCKVWGFVKYFHSAVSTCQVNWDSVLVADMPLVKNAVTKNDFNDALDTLLNAAGPMTIAMSPPPAPLPADQRRNLNFSWINDTLLRNDVQVILDTIKNNFRPHAECWVQDNNYTSSYYGWLVFPHDSLMMPTNISSSCPDEWHRALLLFKYWNIMRYFNPYNYVWDHPWDSTLYACDSLVVTAQTAASFFLNFKMLTANLNDAHVEGLTWSSSEISPEDYYYGPELVLRYLPGKYVAVKSALPNISPGDEIISVNGLTTAQWEDSLRPYISAGNSAVFRRTMAISMLAGPPNSPVAIVSKDSLGNNHTTNTTRSFYVYGSWFSYYPNDTLANVTWKKWGCNVGYVNMGQLQTSDVSTMYNALEYTSAIIFDIRNYPNGTAWPIADLMYPQNMVFSRDLTPDVTYPGTFYWYDDNLGYTGNFNPYQGKVIVLMNEETQSQAEYSCMILDAMPDVVNVGSQTAGTDGNITYFDLTPDVQAGFTTLGIYYPNGDSTERIGIVPDSVVYPTQGGIRHGRDEVLEKALEIAQCWTGISHNDAPQTSLSVYPNPAGDVLYLDAKNTGAGKVQLQVMDITGKVVMQKETENASPGFTTWIDTGNLRSGMYFLQVRTSGHIYTKKFLKE